MTGDLLRFAGGLGLFLLGMVVMTEGLRALAGDALNRLLFRFTKSRWTGAVSGATVTALVQSSSATTVATVGFVSAGLLTYPQALGILCGANVGTTVTGWLVALIGFKLSLGIAMLPVLLAGLLLRLFGRGRLREVGWALAGFALIFVAVDQMRAGMQPFTGVVTPESLPPDTPGGRALLVLVGIGITLVTQSSSAGVAMALTALHAGTVGFGQAAALVIGMDVGTTSTAALATLGGSSQTRRTGFTHVIYNLLTGLGAFLILPVYMTVLEGWGETMSRDPELALVGFHTTFNLIGVVLVLSFARGFARLMYRLVPERGPQLTRRLDLALLPDASAATLALWHTVRDLTAAVFDLVIAQIDAGSRREPEQVGLFELEQAVTEARQYADRLHIGPRQARSHRRHVAALHCLDHLDRLIDRCQQQARVETVRGDARLFGLARELASAMGVVIETLRDGETPTPDAGLKEMRDRVRALRRPYRTETLESVGPQIHLDLAIGRLDAVRWLHRVSYHAWRIAHHLHEVEQPESAQAAQAAQGAIALRSEHDAEGDEDA